MIVQTELGDDERTLLDALAKLPPAEPAGDIRTRFRERAETEQMVGPAPRRWLTPALAAGLVLIIGAGWWLDRTREARDMATLRTELTTALQDLSAARRVAAITSVADSRATDSRILVIAALTASLLSDSSANVRVAAAETLGRIADPVALRDAAQQALPMERSPFVQAALLTATARLSPADRNALAAALLARNDLDPVVRAEAERLART